MKRVEVDILIVGAGPVGLFGAYYAGVRGLRTCIVDSLSQVGGQVSAMYPEKEIFDVAGFPTIVGRDLVKSLVEQAAQYEPNYLLNQEAQKLIRVQGDDGSEHFCVTTSAGTEIDCRAVVVTGGIGTFTPRPLPAGEGYLGHGLDYFVTNASEYRDKDVIVVGGGDSAIDWALMMESIATTVTLVHRREAFRAHPASVAKLHDSSVEVVVNAQAASIEGGTRVEKVVIEIKGQESSRVLSCQQIIAALGFTANLGPLREWGAELQDNRRLQVDSAMQTNVPGLFAAGDITGYEGKVNLIAVGFGEVATAINNAAVYMDPDVQLFPGHSTDLAN